MSKYVYYLIFLYIYPKYSLILFIKLFIHNFRHFRPDKRKNYKGKIRQDVINTADFSFTRIKGFSQIIENAANADTDRTNNGQSGRQELQKEIAEQEASFRYSGGAATDCRWDIEFYILNFIFREVHSVI